jgi:hypothetical protein
MVANLRTSAERDVIRNCRRADSIPDFPTFPTTNSKFRHAVWGKHRRICFVVGKVGIGKGYGQQRLLHPDFLPDLCFFPTFEWMFAALVETAMIFNPS